MPDKPVIITCALTGAAPVKEGHPHIPVTPEEIAASAVASARAGAAAAGPWRQGLGQWQRLGCNSSGRAGGSGRAVAGAAVAAAAWRQWL